MLDADMDVSSPWAQVDEHALKRQIPQGAIRAFPEGAVIISEGDLSDSMYILLSGKVQIYISDDRGKEVVLNTLSAGDYFGEFVLYGGPRTASVIALEFTRVMVVPRAAVNALIADSPEFTRHLLVNLIKKVRSLSDKVRDFALRDVYGRLRTFLLENATLSDEEGHQALDQSYTHQDIALRISTSREMVGRLLKDLTQGDYVKIENKRIVILKSLPNQW